MITYNYECKTCYETFETQQSIIDPPLKKCHKCACHTLERVVGPTDFILKGNGWYKTTSGDEDK